ncbi:hypothetical protein BCR34DRAFT_587046 [Clohesyomyces aquaticus]|uniref:Uncharacterized protein n=1 Tax=Clohesyomyces aquaticus TaxID=1231657 RepID=A0A1Y1ZR94_9PLEO|nr:hypothetical protein BCR34DRAFT_587046 [Clohesyomyces aquaticus]
MYLTPREISDTFCFMASSGTTARVVDPMGKHKKKEKQVTIVPPKDNSSDEDEEMLYPKAIRKPQTSRPPAKKNDPKPALDDEDLYASPDEDEEVVDADVDAVSTDKNEDDLYDEGGDGPDGAENDDDRDVDGGDGVDADAEEDHTSAPPSRKNLAQTARKASAAISEASSNITDTAKRSGRKPSKSHVDDAAIMQKNVLNERTRGKGKETAKETEAAAKGKGKDKEPAKDAKQDKKPAPKPTKAQGKKRAPASGDNVDSSDDEEEKKKPKKGVGNSESKKRKRNDDDGNDDSDSDSDGDDPGDGDGKGDGDDDGKGKGNGQGKEKGQDDGEEEVEKIKPMTRGEFYDVAHDMLEWTTRYFDFRFTPTEQYRKKYSTKIQSIFNDLEDEFVKKRKADEELTEEAVKRLNSLGHWRRHQ